MNLSTARFDISAFLISTLLAWTALVSISSAQTPELPTRLSAIQQAQLDAIRTSREHGLRPADYDIATLNTWATEHSAADAQQFAKKLDGAFRHYAADISRGRLSPQSDPDWHIPQPTTVDDHEKPAADIDGLPPPHAEYQQLHSAMRSYQAVRRLGGWPTIPAGPALSIGMRHPQAEMIRNRLRATGDYDAMTPANSHLYDTGLDAATRTFQARHGLRVTGVVDDRARAAMNVPVDERIAQLAIAMERWRWLPRDLGKEYVWVNAAEAMLAVVVDGTPVVSMRTIVGHSTRPTPSLQSDIKRVVFNPTWSVPYTIAIEDLLPKLRNDRTFLARNSFRVYTRSRNPAGNTDLTEIDPADVDWNNVNTERFPYRFVQRPGPGNSLGRVKLVFDNPYDIYIHDTPSRGLFALRTRTFSSGCVRMEQAMALANFLLTNDRNWSDADTRQILANERTRNINLQHTVPIYIVYITSWVDDHDQVNFRRDLYRRDAAVQAAWAKEN